MKKNFLIVILSLIIVSMVCGCNRKTGEDKIAKEKEKFGQNLTEAINLVKDIEITEAKKYTIEDDLIYDAVYNTDSVTGEVTQQYVFEKGLNGYNFDEGFVYVKDQNNIYATVSNEVFCAIKDLSSDEVKVYDISEKENCHSVHIMDGSDSAYINLIALDKTDYSVYDSSKTTSGDIMLIAVSNLLDPDSYSYKWYRNGYEVSTDTNSFTIGTSQNNSSYYVEIISSDGSVLAKSDSIIVNVTK